MTKVESQINAFMKRQQELGSVDPEELRNRQPYDMGIFLDSDEEHDGVSSRAKDVLVPHPKMPQPKKFDVPEKFPRPDLDMRKHCARAVRVMSAKYKF